MSTKSKPLFVETSALTSRNISGIGHTLISILKEWKENEDVKSRFQPILLVPFDKKNRVEALGIGLPIKTILIPEIIFRALRRFNSLPYMDIFFGKGDYLFPNYWNWPLLFSKSYTYIYDVGFMVYPEFTEVKNQKFLSRYLKIWTQRTDGIITISNHAKDELVKYTNIDKKKIKVIYNGVDMKPGKSITKLGIDTTKAKYQINGKYILFVGNIEPRKNIQRLIAAYRLLPVGMRDVHSLVLVGAYGWRNEEIKQSIETAAQDGLRIIKIKEFVPDVDIIKLYAGAELLVHPALYEGFGMTPLEAMTVSTPTIVGNNSSLPEVMGNASLYVDAMDEVDISAKIKKLLEDKTLRKKIVDAGNIRVRQFTWRHTVEKIAEFIEGRTHE